MKHIVVTGSGGGMGRAVCRLLLGRGYRVYGLDRRQEPLEGLVPVTCDVTDAAAVAEAAARVGEHTGRLDGIVHTAGIYDLDSLLEMEEERFCRVFEVNLFGVYRVNRAFAPMLERGGRIVIVTSELAPLDPLPFTGVYAVSKTALEGYAASLSMETDLLGIRVSVIRPGAVDTGLLGDSTRALDRFCEETALYTCNADRFRRVVNSVETRNVPPEAVAKKVLRALEQPRPRLVYNLNRNPLLRLLNVLPRRWQMAAIKLILR